MITLVGTPKSTDLKVFVCLGYFTMAFSQFFQVIQIGCLFIQWTCMLKLAILKQYGTAGTTNSSPIWS